MISVFDSLFIKRYVDDTAFSGQPLIDDLQHEVIKKFFIRHLAAEQVFKPL
jgi:hypothetical protein